MSVCARNREGSYKGLQRTKAFCMGWVGMGYAHLLMLMLFSFVVDVGDWGWEVGCHFLSQLLRRHYGEKEIYISKVFFS